MLRNTIILYLSLSRDSAGQLPAAFAGDVSWLVAPENSGEQWPPELTEGMQPACEQGQQLLSVLMTARQRRHAVECCNNRLERNQAAADHYDKPTVRYEARSATHPHGLYLAGKLSTACGAQRAAWGAASSPGSGRRARP